MSPSSSEKQPASGVPINRRTFLELSALGLAATAFDGHLATGETAPATPDQRDPVLRVDCDPQRPSITFLSWDTEGGGRVQQNLLRAGSAITLRLRSAGQWHDAADLEVRREETNDVTRYHLGLKPDGELVWEIRPARGRLTWNLSAQGAGASGIEAVEIAFPLDPKVTPTTILPSSWAADGTFSVPAVVSAPDFGQMLLSCEAPSAIRGSLTGNRVHHEDTGLRLDLTLELTAFHSSEVYKLEFTPLFLPPPSGLKDKEMWPLARRGWFNMWQCSAQWGDQGRAFSAPAGILGNNVISDPASVSTIFYADGVIWTPNLAPGLSIAALLRSTIDWWLDERTHTYGGVVGYWDYDTFLDAGPGPLVCAWDYVEATGDRDWLQKRIERLELVAECLALRDLDNDGIFEAFQSGNAGTLIEPARGSCWWDAVNTGYKDAYSNALIYRALRCLAELEGSLSRSEKKERYHRLADRLKASYGKAFYNPKTGWLGWWRSADGELHDYASTVVNALAVEYGLVDAQQGRQILDRLWQKIQSVGFNRFDLGLPGVLEPIRRLDYLIGLEGFGIPKRDDGTDAFGRYQNGGVSAAHTLHFLAACYVIGETERAETILHAMLGRQVEGKFQNGVRNKKEEGMEWTTWDGKPCGYEGFLADNYYFLLAILLREDSFRRRYYRPLSAS